MADLTAFFNLFLDALMQQANPFLTDGKPLGFHPQLQVEMPGGWWLSLIVFICFTIIVVLRVFDNRRLTQLLTGFVRASSLSIYYREESALTGRVSLLLVFNFLLIVPLFLWQFIAHTRPDLATWSLFPSLVLIIALMYSAKIISMRFLGFLFEQREASNEYTFTILLFNKTIGLILFPIVVLLAFSQGFSPQILLLTGGLLWSIALIYRLFRCLLIGMGTGGLSLLYFLLYLCTLEILPFVVIFKVFVGKF
ncbi:MAG: DUF4271 domain-containing protein [Bacteroidia bacterium]